ncbi:hypothetical protein H8F25_16475 [Synechococcus sp. CBW1004]|nr:hypothetical protein H8F25_16475 [Synechococcus sp. CBW1004]
MAGHLDTLGHPGAEPLRWAITGIDPHHGLRIEGIGLHRVAAAAGLAGDPATNTAPPRPQEHGNASGSEAQ